MSLNYMTIIDPISNLMILWAIKLALIAYFLYKYWIGTAKKPIKTPTKLDHFPKVCVQLPLYNEPYHCQKLIECVSKLDWPTNQLEIQVLDDSTDQSSKLIADSIKKLSYEKPCLVIKHIRRKHRHGYKAGSLNHGLNKTDADYFAIFDCDFRPHHGFLKAAMPYFKSDRKIAAVQVPWGYYNANTNLLTWVQSLLLICHFHRDHRGRFNRGLIFHFNGTAGIWNRHALEKLGGFSANTVTEDLYLSLKAWLSGFKIWYADLDTCKSELPPTLASFFVQQRRWARGNGQVLRLLGKQLFKQLPYTIQVRADTILQLIGYGISSFFLIFYFLSPYWIFIYDYMLSLSSDSRILRLVDTSLWLGVFASFLLLFFPRASAHKYYSHSLPPKFFRIYLVMCLIWLAPLFAILIGTSFWSGLLTNGKSPSNLHFARTPKRYSTAGLDRQDQWILSFMIVFALICSGFAFWWRVTVPALYFFGQASLLTYMYLRESKYKGYDQTKIPSNLKKHAFD